jgi:hypothetical protein
MSKFNGEGKDLEMNYLKSLPSLMQKEEIDLEVYVRRRRTIEEKYKQTKSWDTIITSVVYFDEPTSQEAFIDIIEETYHSNVRDPKHLIELTGISVNWTAETLNNFLQLCIYTNRETKYSNAIENAFRFGAKYADILKYELKDFGLPEAWINWWGMETNKDDLIKMAIYYAFELSDDCPGTDIKKVEEQLEGPFDLVYDVVTYYGAYLDSKGVVERFEELRLKGLSISDAAENNEPFELDRWN